MFGVGVKNLEETWMFGAGVKILKKIRGQSKNSGEFLTPTPPFVMFGVGVKILKEIRGQSKNSDEFLTPTPPFVMFGAGVKILKKIRGQSKNSGEFLTLTPPSVQNFYSDPMYPRLLTCASSPQKPRQASKDGVGVRNSPEFLL